MRSSVMRHLPRSSMSAPTIRARSVHAPRLRPSATWMRSAQWLQPYPYLNYSWQRRANEPAAAGGYRTALQCTAMRATGLEPVPLRLRSLGSDVDVRWQGDGDDGQVVVETPNRVWQATIDPDRELIEDRRDDNATLRAAGC
jgi:hypothetical protein